MREEFLSWEIQIEFQERKYMELVFFDVLGADLHVLGHILYEGRKLARGSLGFIHLVRQQ